MDICCLGNLGKDPIVMDLLVTSDVYGEIEFKECGVKGIIMNRLPVQKGKGRFKRVGGLNVVFILLL